MLPFIEMEWPNLQVVIAYAAGSSVLRWQSLNWYQLNTVYWSGLGAILKSKKSCYFLNSSRFFYSLDFTLLFLHADQNVSRNMIHALLFHLFVCIVLFEISFSLLQKYKYSEISLYFFFTLIINVRKYAMCGVEK